MAAWRAVLVVCPNLALDRTLSVDVLRPGQVHRPSSVLTAAGGKGANVARAANDLGYDALLLGFLAGRNGETFAELAAADGLDTIGVPAPGELRQATIILEADGRATVLNEAGPELDRDALDALLAAVTTAAGGHRLVVGTGSVPPGLPEEVYARIVEQAHRAGARAVVDTSGPALLASLAAEPDVVKPNLAEAEGALAGHPPVELDLSLTETSQRALDAAGGLLARGAAAAVVTAGRHGLAAATATERWWLDAPAVDAVNTVGAGDALAAALAGALERDDSLRAATEWAVAAAAGAVATPGAGRVDADLVRRLAATRPPRSPAVHPAIP